MQSYEDNCSKLSKLLNKHHYFLIGHRNLTENAWKTIMQANDALKKAGKLVEKYKSRTIVRILKDGLGITLRSELKKYEKLKREMEENNSKVESLLQQINEIIESQPELVGGQVTFDTPDMEETTFRDGTLELVWATSVGGAGSGSGSRRFRRWKKTTTATKSNIRQATAIPVPAPIPALTVLDIPVSLPVGVAVLAPVFVMAFVVSVVLVASGDTPVKAALKAELEVEAEAVERLISLTGRHGSARKGGCSQSETWAGSYG
ncbi:hypothetical protein CEP53_012319 [Fusarium sp. AF-6]|nr:hypothetical protein CEP53_012319 [Fusarium sp. AF-6]